MEHVHKGMEDGGPDGLGGVSDTTEVETVGMPSVVEEPNEPNAAALKFVFAGSEDDAGFATSSETHRGQVSQLVLRSAMWAKSIPKRSEKVFTADCSAILFGYQLPQNMDKPKPQSADFVCMFFDDLGWYTSENDAFVLSAAMMVLTYGFPYVGRPMAVRLGPVTDNGPVVIGLHRPQTAA